MDLSPPANATAEDDPPRPPSSAEKTTDDDELALFCGFSADSNAQLLDSEDEEPSAAPSLTYGEVERSILLITSTTMIATDPDAAAPTVEAGARVRSLVDRLHNEKFPSRVLVVDPYYQALTKKYADLTGNSTNRPLLVIEDHQTGENSVYFPPEAVDKILTYASAVRGGTWAAEDVPPEFDACIVWRGLRKCSDVDLAPFVPTPWEMKSSSLSQVMGKEGEEMRVVAFFEEREIARVRTSTEAKESKTVGSIDTKQKKKKTTKKNKTKKKASRSTGN